VAQLKVHFKRVLVLSILGFIIGFVSLLTCVVLVANPLRRLGVPPATWFGSDYTDPRCAVLSGGLELLFLGLFAFAVATVLNRRFGFAGRLSAFWLCNPVSVAFGLLVARRLVLNGVAYEFTAPVSFLLFVCWPVAWHLALTGFRKASTAKAIALATGYVVIVIAVGLIRVRSRYLLP
jgi:hypothetical protein